MPLLPLRDVVLFPGVSLPLFVGRERSVAAVKQALEENGLLFAVTQKSADITEPTGRDLYRVGTYCQVTEHTHLPDGTMRIVATGMARGRLNRLIVTGRAFEAKTTALPDLDPEEEEPPLEELRGDVLGAFETYVSLGRRLSGDVVSTARRFQGPSEFSFFVAGYVVASVSVRQRLLESKGWLPRLRRLREILSSDVRILKLEKQGGRPMRVIPASDDLGRDDRRRGGDHPADDGDDIDELRDAVEKAQMPDPIRTKANREIQRLSRMNPISPEATVSRTYVDWLLSLPWKKRSRDRLDLDGAEEILNEDHYGLRKVKDRILEYIAVLKLSRTLKGPVLCLVGPPGVGKTSLGRSIARALGRKLVRMSLGGVRDEAEIRGHRRTYIGSMPGRIIQAMRRAGTVNPLILLDEIDKLGSDYRGDPAAALLEVLDPEQNNAFQDHYLDCDYDLSQVMFVVTANSLDGVHPALRDRLEVLKLHGYLEHEKLEIAKRYLVPRQREACGLSETDLTVSEDALRGVIRERTRESGVRNLEREIAGFCRKAARRRAATVDDQGPLVVTGSNLTALMGAPRFVWSEVVTQERVGVATGLAWTEVGGEILNVEVTPLPGRGRLLLTGKLGETMQESGQAALSYIRARGALFGLDSDFNERLDIHVHLPQGGVPKDGPSAGVTMALAMVSAVTGTPTRADVALTGEITLRGTVLPVGGLAEKLMAAKRASIACVLVPEENAPQIAELPEELREGLEIITVRNMDEVIEYGLDGRVESGEHIPSIAATH